MPLTGLSGDIIRQVHLDVGPLRVNTPWHE